MALMIVSILVRHLLPDILRERLGEIPGYITERPFALRSTRKTIRWFAVR